jgi:hypothetical protein
MKRSPHSSEDSEARARVALCRTVSAKRASKFVLSLAGVLVVGALLGVLLGVLLGLVIRPGGRPSVAQAGPIDYPRGETDVLLRIESRPTQPNQVAPPPLFTLYGDGTAIVAAEPPPAGQALPGLQAFHLPAPAVREVLRRAAAAGLTGPSAVHASSGGTPTENEVFTMSVSGMRRQTVFEGDVTDPSAFTGADAAPRARFAALQTELMDLGSILPPGSAPAEEYMPRQLAVYVGPAQVAPPVGSGAPVVAWPLESAPGAGLAALGSAGTVEGYRCAVLEGQALDRVASAASQAAADTLWRSKAKDYPVIFKPLLPDERGC